MNYQYWQWYHARVRELQIAVVRGPVANQESRGDNKRAITRRWC
ncbi:hypothetical protein [Pantoea sp.]|nr:hypothetical protein [Pantoea sp.]